MSNNGNDEKEMRNILLVDDDDDLRYLMAEYFYHIGYNVVLASDGDEAFELFQHQKFDLVITDVRMPKMNGLRLLRHIKSSYPNLPIILMTGFELSKRDLANMRYNADAYIAKPFSLEYMRKIIESLMDKK
ncbi:MAG: response regulator [Candidatus Cloacimonetes bacterium]|nr:response regulator [Candidatus Cloacimonadota bacterium]